MSAVSCVLAAVLGSAQAALITWVPTGTAGTVYDASAAAGDVTYDSSQLSGIDYGVDNADLAGRSDKMVIASDGTGLTQPGTTVDWWENDANWDNRAQATTQMLKLDIQEAAAGKSFELDSVSVQLSGVAGNGIRMRLIYRTGGGAADLKTVDFNGGNNITSDGTYTADFQSGLVFTDSSTPLLDGQWVRLAIYDPDTGDNTSGTAVIERMEVNVIPEPATLGLVGASTLGLLALRRLAM
jgi:hypothetical protein